jgi:hypothetical protein
MSASEHQYKGAGAAEQALKAELTSLSFVRGNLRRAVEEAEWLGEDERLASLELELEMVEDKIAKGQLYEPNW